MIDFISNSNIFRRVPYQSGIYQIDLSIFLDNHNSNVEFNLSGNGSIFYRFGADSGNYFTSGFSKNYFEANVPNVLRSYSFVVSDNKFDVYDGNNNPLVLGGAKPTGVLQRIGVSTSSGIVGEYSLTLKGTVPSFLVTGDLVFPTNSQFQKSIYVVNSGLNAFSVLSGSFDSISTISGLSGLPMLVQPNTSGVLNFSGNISSLSNTSTLLVLNTDFQNSYNNILITATTFSGSGYSVTLPSSPVASFNNSVDFAPLVFNSGTTTLTFTPQIVPYVEEILIPLPQYSGTNLRNYFSGYFDTTGVFYPSDKITSSGVTFYIIGQNQSGVTLLNITGESTTTGIPLGGNASTNVGQSFVFPYSVHVTGFNMRLATLGGTFSGSDVVFGQIYQGVGVTGSLLATSTSVLCTSISSGLSSGQSFNFATIPVLLSSGTEYSIALSGNSRWVGANSSEKVILLQNTGNPYGQGSGFYVNGTITQTTGDACLLLEWLPASGANRYLANFTNGINNDFINVSTGTYDKYCSSQSFITTNETITSLPNSNINFNITYSGMVSGINKAYLVLTGIGYSTLISGETI